MRSDEVYKIAGGIIIALTIMIGILAVIKMISISPLWSDQGAAWVQAIGSIAALGVAIFVMNRQNLHGLKLQQEADHMATKKRAHAVAAIVEHTHRRIAELLTNLKVSIQSGDFPDAVHTWKAAKIVAGELRTLLSSIPLYDLGSTDLIDGVFKTIEVTGYFLLIGEGSAAYSSISGTAESAALIEAQAERAHSQFKRGMEDITKQIDHVSAEPESRG